MSSLGYKLFTTGEKIVKKSREMTNCRSKVLERVRELELRSPVEKLALDTSEATY